MVRPLTNHVFECLMLDMWPRPAGKVDFGLDSTEHLGALQHAVKHDGVTPEMLDEALGNGKKLTALIQDDNPYHGVVFETSYDLLGAFDDDEDDEVWEDDNVQPSYGEKGYEN